MRARAATAGEFVAIVVTALSCALSVQAEPSMAAQAPRVVGLDECIRLGFAHDAGLRTDELETRIADARVQEMQRQYAPSLSLQAGYSRLSDVAPGQSLSVVAIFCLALSALTLWLLERGYKLRN